MRKWNMFMGVALVLMLGVSAQATDYLVGSVETYGTVQAALTAAMGNTSGDHNVIIMESGVYDETISDVAGGDLTASVTIKGAAGVNASVYGISNNGTQSSLIYTNLTIDGNIHDWTDELSGASEVPIYLRSAANTTFEGVTFKGRGTGESFYLYGNGTGKVDTFNNCIFDTDSVGILGYNNPANGSVVVTNNTFKTTAGYAMRNVLGSAQGTFIENNIFTSAGIAVRQGGVSIANAVIDHNTFYNVGGDDEFNGSGVMFLRDVGTGDLGAIFSNNLIVGSRGSNYAIRLYDGQPDSLDVDNNGFYDLPFGSDRVVQYGGSWQTLATLNGLTGASGNIYGDADPFVDAANGDFNLVESSWALFGEDGYIGALAPTTTEIPEPGTLLLVGTGVLGVIGYVRRRRMQ